MADLDRFPLIGYAYELIPGDMVVALGRLKPVGGGREVVSIDDPDRPQDLAPLMPAMGEGAVTVHFTSGEPEEMDRMATLYFTREASVVLAAQFTRHDPEG